MGVTWEDPTKWRLPKYGGEKERISIEQPRKGVLGMRLNEFVLEDATLGPESFAPLHHQLQRFLKLSRPGERG